MNADERKLVVETWNETAQAYPDTASAPGLFEEQAALMPDGVALMFEGHMMSYGELLDCTSRLARRLHEGGVGKAQDDYTMMSVARLRSLCAEYSIELPKRAGKANMLKALENHCVDHGDEVVGLCVEKSIEHRRSDRNVSYLMYILVTTLPRQCGGVVVVLDSPYFCGRSL